MRNINLTIALILFMTKLAVADINIDKLENMAESGNPDAQHNLAIDYYEGVRVEKDLSKAFYWYQKAADAGSVESQFNLAKMYRKGEGVDRDIEKAIYWFKKCADKNISQAYHELGVIYKNGDGVPVDLVLAKKYFEHGAMLGYFHSQGALGHMLARGLGVEVNNIEAFAWLFLSYKKFPHELTQQSMGVVLKRLNEEGREAAYKKAQEYEILYYR